MYVRVWSMLGETHTTEVRWKISLLLGLGKGLRRKKKPRLEWFRNQKILSVKGVQA
jgi:hypothetical protein